MPEQKEPITRWERSPGLAGIRDRTLEIHKHAALAHVALRENANNGEIERLWTQLHQCDQHRPNQWDVDTYWCRLDALRKSQAIELDSGALLDALERRTRGLDAKGEVAENRVLIACFSAIIRDIREMRLIKLSAA